MTKLWLVITVFGKVAMATGPLDIDIDACRERALARSAMLDRAYVEQKLDDDPEMMVEGQRVKRADIKIDCIYANERPRGDR
jgi:hypothetical protein